MDATNDTEKYCILFSLRDATPCKIQVLDSIRTVLQCNSNVIQVTLNILNLSIYCSTVPCCCSRDTVLLGHRFNRTLMDIPWNLRGV